MNYENIKLEKGMYGSGKSFTNILESLDPSEQYEGTEMAGLDAFERQLKRFDINVKGASSDQVQKFFATTQSSALFPEFVARKVRAGIDGANLLPSIVATTTHIDSLDYRTITSNPTNEEKELKEVAEGEEIPETTVKTKENLVSLKKRGRMLIASYEALKFQRLDLFAVTLKQIGAYIARQQFNDAVNVLINGDGNENPAKIIALKDEANGLTYSDLINLWNQFDNHELNTIIASGDMCAKMLEMSQFMNMNTGSDFAKSGNLITPFGAKLIKGSSLDDGTVIGLDNTAALEMVIASDVNIDYDKLIDRQLERAAISCIAGFAKIFDDASVVLG